MKEAAAEPPLPLPGGFTAQIMRRIDDVVPSTVVPASLGLRLIGAVAMVALISSAMVAAISWHAEPLPALTLFQTEAVSFTASSR